MRLGSIGPQVAEGATRQLRGAVRRPDLWRLASSPLLLTVMALVHTHHGRLPGSRALLYEEAIDILLWRWEQIKVSGGDQRPLLQQLLIEAGRADVDLKRVLRQLAYEAHQGAAAEDMESVADTAELSLRKRIQDSQDLGSWWWRLPRFTPCSGFGRASTDSRRS